MKSDRLTHHPLIRFSFVALVIFFNIYFGIIIFEHWTVEDDIIGRVSGTLLLLIMLQIWLVAVYNILLIVWKWIWKYEV